MLEKPAETMDALALACYRYERIVEDSAVYCEQLFLSDEGGADREQALRHLASNFLPNHTIPQGWFPMVIAYRSDKTLGMG